MEKDTKKAAAPAKKAAPKKTAAKKTEPKAKAAKPASQPKIEAKSDKKCSCLCKCSCYMTVPLVERVLSFAKSGFICKFIEPAAGIMETVGLCGVYFASLVSLVAGILIACTIEDAFNIGIILAISGFILGIVIHYTDWKFFPKLRKQIEQSPSVINSAEIFDCLAVINIIVGVMMFLAALGMLFYLNMMIGYQLFFIFIFSFIIFEYLAVLMLNLDKVNTTIDEKTPVEEEAIDLLAVFAKLFLKITPLLLAMASVYVSLALIDLILSEGAAFAVKLAMIPQLFALLLMPLIAYIAFILYQLAIGLVKAVLAIPAKK